MQFGWIFGEPTPDHNFGLSRKHIRPVSVPNIEYFRKNKNLEEKKTAKQNLLMQYSVPLIPVFSDQVEFPWLCTLFSTTSQMQGLNARLGSLVHVYILK